MCCSSACKLFQDLFHEPVYIEGTGDILKLEFYYFKFFQIPFNIISRNPSIVEPLKTHGVKTQETKIIITYLIRVFDTTWQSKFWALIFLFLGQFFILSC